MRLILSIIILFSSIYTTFAKTRYYELVDSVEKNISDCNWADAENFLLKILREYPDDNNNSLIISNLATVQRYQGKYNEAIKNYSFAIHITPNSTTLIKNRASLYLDLDSLHKAKDDYERLILIDDKDEESHYYHGILSIRLGDMDAAKKDFDYILHFNPASGLGREGLALWYKERGDNYEAVKYYTELINFKPTAIHYSNRAECYLAQKKYNSAADDIKKALILSPDDGYLYIIRAKLNKARFQYKDMEQDLQMAEKYGYDRKFAEAIINSK